MKKNQVFAGIALIAAMVFFGIYLRGKTETLTLFLITGLILGYILTRSRYGFAGGIKKIYLTGDGSLTKAILLLFAITVVGAAGVHYGAASKGAEIVSRAVDGNPIIPGSQFVKATSLLTILGGIICGIGMVIGDGCALAIISDAGEGSIRAWILILFFSLGGVLGQASLQTLETSFLGRISTEVIYLPDYLGYLGSVVLSLLIILGLYIGINFYEDKRRREMGLRYEKLEEVKGVEDLGEYKLFSYQTYDKFFIERWSFNTGSFLIAGIFIFIMTTTESSWGASEPYSLWGVWLVEKLGFSLSGPSFEGLVKLAQLGLTNNPDFLRNLGIIFGSAISFLLAGRFKLDLDYKIKDILYYIFAGLLMGYGARIGLGCNIGGLYSGIANFSLSGWTFFLALFTGSILGLKIFAGRVNTIEKKLSK